MIPPYHLLLPRSTSPLHDLLLQQPSFGDTTALTRKIEEICARRTITLLVVIVLGVVAITGTKVEVLDSGSLSTGIMPVTTTANTNTVAAMEEMDEVLIPIRDWFEAPESMKIYGSEKFVNAVYY